MDTNKCEAAVRQMIINAFSETPKGPGIEYSSELSEALAGADKRAIAAGEECGWLDYDPVSHSQGDLGKAKILSIKSISPTVIKAKIRLDNFGTIQNFDLIFVEEYEGARMKLCDVIDYDQNGKPTSLLEEAEKAYK